MRKAEIRKLALNQRQLLSKTAVALLSDGLLARFSKLDFSSVKTIHIFLPIEERNEPDTFLFISWLTVHHPQMKIIVPKADFETALMSSHLYRGTEDLKKNLYNILEPQKAELHTGEIDMVVVPLIGFDKRGYRVGYGKGFYDRFLENIVIQKVGISFFEPVDRIDDVHQNDIRLDLCLTPERVYDFSS